MKLIRELITEAVDSVIEESEGKKKLYITGPFAVCEEKNKNGRIYPRGVMEEAVTKYVNEKVSPKMAWGELGHPQGPKINETLVSHLIEEVKWDGNNVMGKAQVTLGTPNGKTLAGLIESGGRVGVSTRALGTVKENTSGLLEVQSGLKFATLADAVLDPSAPGAFVNGIMESVEYFYDSEGTLQSRAANECKQIIKKLSKSQLEESYFRIFKYYLDNIN